LNDYNLGYYISEISDAICNKISIIINLFIEDLINELKKNQ